MSLFTLILWPNLCDIIIIFWDGGRLRCSVALFQGVPTPKGRRPVVPEASAAAVPAMAVQPPLCGLPGGILGRIAGKWREIGE